MGFVFAPGQDGWEPCLALLQSRAQCYVHFTTCHLSSGNTADKLRNWSNDDIKLLQCLVQIADVNTAKRTWSEPSWLRPGLTRNGKIPVIFLSINQ